MRRIREHAHAEGERQPVLGTIGGILRRIESDFIAGYV